MYIEHKIYSKHYSFGIFYKRYRNKKLLLNLVGPKYSICLDPQSEFDYNSVENDEVGYLGLIGFDVDTEAPFATRLAQRR